MERSEAKNELNDAIQAFLLPEEISLRWHLVLEVVGPNGKHYLKYRVGAGHDGNGDVMIWEALGLLHAATIQAEQQLLEITEDADDDEP